MIKPAIGILVVSYGCAACSESGFTSSTKKTTALKKSNVASEMAKGLPVARDAKVMPGPEKVGISFQGNTAIQSAASEAETWVVTDSEVTRIKLDEAAGWPQTKWTMVDENGQKSSNSGHRTYVSEIGLLIGRTNRSGNNGGVWLASDNNPGKAIPIFRPTDQASGSRLSVTSFKVGPQPYIGMAYGTTAGKKKFVRIPIDKNKPTGIDIARKEEVSLSGLNESFGGFSAVGGTTAYGSFMDQKNKAFYLGGLGAGIWGVDVEKMVELPSSKVPNLNAAGRKMCDYTLQTTTATAYALSGDLNGNIVTASGAYTFAHDPVNNVVLGGRGGKMTLAKQECVSANGQACTQAANQCAIFTPQEAGAIGPVSAVGDGRIVGIARGNDTSQVFLLSVVNKDDLSKGVKITKVADINGDAYMYNDFTGLTLYAPDQVRVIDFKALKGFQAGKPVKAVAVGWSASSKNVEDLRGLKIEVVCYKQGSQKGPYIDYTKELSTSASLFTLAPKDCGGLVDTLEVKVSSDGSTNNFSRLSLLEMRGAQ